MGNRRGLQQAMDMDWSGISLSGADNGRWENGDVEGSEGTYVKVNCVSFRCTVPCVPYRTAWLGGS